MDLPAVQRSSEWSPGLIATAGIVAVSTLGFLLFDSRGTTAPPGLHVDEDALDLGTVWARSDFQWTVPVENRSSRTIVVSHVEASCACTNVKPSSFTLRPTSRQQLALRLNLFPPTGVTPGYITNFGVSLDFRDENGRRIAQKTLHGRVRYPLVGSPVITYYGPDQLVEHTPGLEKRCELRRDYELTDVILGEHDFPGTARLEKAGVGSTVWLSVRPFDGLRPGRFEYDIPLVGILEDGTHLPDFPVRINGWVGADVKLVPSRLSLPLARIGETVRMTVQVHSQSGEPLRVKEAAALTDAVAVTLLDEEAAGGPLYEVSKTINAGGAVDDNVRFIFEKHDGTGGSITAAVRSYGLATGETSR
ncbi:MAG: DUF1573 domain-containing protein [Planctomycetaceae bacterium]|nr:DUF1573 domain-containing protein [Planctomycetaceae bacterium]